MKDKSEINVDNINIGYIIKEIEYLKEYISYICVCLCLIIFVISTILIYLT